MSASRPQIRLDVAETEMVSYLVSRDNSEISNPTELFRLLRVAYTPYIA